MNNAFLLFVQITPKQEYYDQAKAALLSIIDQTRNEKGCYQFELTQGESDGSLFLYEEWANQQALDEHYAQPYIVHVFQKYEQWLSCPVEITRLRKVA